MEIIARTPSRLELGYRGGNLALSKAGATLFGIAFLGFGIWGIFAGRQRILKCIRLDPEQVECQIASAGIIGSQTMELDDVKRAEIVTRENRNYGRRDRLERDVYGVVLIADSRSLAVSSVSTSNYAVKQADVDRINSFIRDPQQFTLKMQDDGRGLGLIVGSILASIGGAVIYALWQIKIVSNAVFDRNLNLLRVQKKSVYGKLEQLDWHLREIKELFIEESEGKENIYYSINLQFSSGQRSSLTLLRTSDRLEAETLATNIEEFLD